VHFFASLEHERQLLIVGQSDFLVVVELVVVDKADEAVQNPSDVSWKEGRHKSHLPEPLIAQYIQFGAQDRQIPDPSKTGPSEVGFKQTSHSESLLHSKQPELQRMQRELSAVSP